MKTFPIMLDVRGKLAVVIGGGAVGARKAQQLLAAEARVRLVSKTPPKEPLPGADVRIGEYQPADLDGAFLVIAATDDAKLNAAIAADARKMGVLVNVADQPADCDFYLPAIISDGDVIVAIGTGGSAPSLAAGLKSRLAAAMPPKIGEFAAALSGIREELKSLVADVNQRGRIMKHLAQDEVYQDFLRDGAASLRHKLAELVAGIRN